jgi:hypothetical protein
VIAIHESTGSYALDALDRAELADFEAHLALCCDCRLEVTDFSETAAELTLLTETTPPAALRDSILSSVGQTRQLPPQPAQPAQVSAQLPAQKSADPSPARATPRTSHRSGARRALHDSDGEDDPEPTAADELALLRQARQNRLLTGVVAAMLAVLVGLGGTVYTLSQQRKAQVAQVDLENELYRSPDTETVVVDVSIGGRAIFVVSKQLNRAIFLGTDLRDPGPTDRYTLWTATGTLKQPTGVVLDTQVAERVSGSKQLFRGDIRHANLLALNIEPVGSAPAAPTTPVLAAALI